MKGTRPLTTDEIIAVSESFRGIYEIRNRSLFILGISTGGRISELLSLKIGDVFQNGSPVTDLLYSRKITKGQQVSRVVPVNSDAQAAIEDAVRWYQGIYGKRIWPNRPLFPSRNGKGKKPMVRRQAHGVLKDAFITAGLNGHIATHSLRKSFAQRLYDKTGDIFVVQEMLGHAAVSTTQAYVGVNYQSVRDALQSLSLFSTESHSFAVLGNSLEHVSDAELLLELGLRGYDLSSARQKVGSHAV